jgi:sugar phosphate isomerase/epimerase
MYSSFNARAVGLSNLSAEVTIDVAAEAGFDGVDLMARDLVLAGADPKAIRSRMDDLGLQGGAFPFPFNWRGEEASFLKGLEELPRLAEAARLLGLTRTGTWVMPETWEREVNRRFGRDELAALHVLRLGAIARVLDQFGIKLGLEVIGVESFRTGGGEPFVARLEDLDRELGAIWGESANLGILLDVFHLYAADEPVEAGLRWGVERVIWVHVADLPPLDSPDRRRIIDANRGLPGENGAIDVRGFLAKMGTQGYEGPVTAEPLGNCGSILGLEPLAVARRVKQSLDSVWPEPTVSNPPDNLRSLA